MIHVNELITNYDICCLDIRLFFDSVPFGESGSSRRSFGDKDVLIRMRVRSKDGRSTEPPSVHLFLFLFRFDHLFLEKERHACDHHDRPKHFGKPSDNPPSCAFKKRFWFVNLDESVLYN